jgi:hypothetical protein
LASKSIFDAPVREELLERATRLTPQSKPAFGKMNVNQMVVHCTSGIGMMIGELKVAPKAGPLRNPVLRYLIIHVLPWPKGAPTAPELIPPPDAGDFTQNVTHLRAAINRIGARNPEGKFDQHPAFGEINGNNLGVLVARHLDHHFRQFGV